MAKLIEFTSPPPYNGWLVLQHANRTTICMAAGRLLNRGNTLGDVVATILNSLNENGHFVPSITTSQMDKSAKIFDNSCADQGEKIIVRFKKGAY